MTIYDQATQRFEFHQGPIFANVVLADEINRASPKTQSALLEVMEESQVTVDGVTHQVGRPFMVIATQNPIEQAGTYRLPEAQLDRFLMKTSLGYPDHASTVQILASATTARHGTRRSTRSSRPSASPSMIDLASDGARRPRAARVRLALAEATRDAPDVRAGLQRPRRPRPGAGGPRLGRGVRAATTCCPTTSRSWPMPVLAHRMVLDPEEEFRGATTPRACSTGSSRRCRRPQERVGLT